MINPINIQFLGTLSISRKTLSFHMFTEATLHSFATAWYIVNKTDKVLLIEQSMII